jgi:hypothetical protein
MRSLALISAILAAVLAWSAVAPIADAHTGLEPKLITVCKPRSECLNGGGNRWTKLFETQYLQRVLPNEWVCSWNAQAVQAGAVAVRTYGWWRVQNPRSPSYDIYGDSNDQVFKDASSNSTCSARIAATAGTRVEYNGNRIKAQYRAETGNPTKDGGKPYLLPVADPHTTTATTGPGLCQNGSKWYGDNGNSYSFILHHYYTNVTVRTGAAYYLSDVSCSCSPSCFLTERWKDTSDGSTFTRVVNVPHCP